MSLRLVSHALCPYVQRVAIALIEKGAAFERTDVDLARKPDWFLRLSPLGKTPVLVADGTPVFESAVILEYLEETLPRPLLPAAPLARARHRSWVVVGSAALDDIAGLYAAPDAAAFAVKTAALRAKLARLEDALGEGPYFAGPRFGLADAAFGPVFRYLDAFDRIPGLDPLGASPKLRRWRRALADRPSVRAAAPTDYHARLWEFLRARRSHLTTLMPSAAPEAAAGG